MTAEHWAKVRALVEQAIDVPAHERAELLDRATDDLDLRLEAAQLLEYEQEACKMFAESEAHARCGCSPLSESSLAGGLVNRTAR